MQQYNLITDPQAQIGYKVSQAQLCTKRKDLSHLEALKPHLKQLQQNSAKLVKDYHQYLSNKERKMPGLPYHMIKKFQILQSTLYDTRKILTTQCRSFEVELAARDFEKDNEQNFFKKTMKSYDERRLWLKNYILKNEQKMQIVEEEVKKNVDYQTHKFTKYVSQVDLQRLFHNYEPKMEAEDQLLKTIKRNAELKDRIKKKLADHKQKVSNNTENQQSKQEMQQQKPKIKKLDFQSKAIHSFLYSYLIEKNIQNKFLISELKHLKSQKSTLSFKGQQLKIAIDLQSQNLDDIKLQWNIIQSNYRNNLLNLLEEKITSNCNFTKTDYFIYLREIHRKIAHKMKLYGVHFQYLLLFPEISMYQRTKSVSKHYPLPKITGKLKNIENKKMKQFIKGYLEKEKDNIQASRREKQRKRLQNEKQQMEENKHFQNNHQQLLKQLEDTPKKQTTVEKQILDELQEESFKQIGQDEI